MNIDQKMRAWQDVQDGGGAGDLRRALGEALDQLRHQLASVPAPAEELNLTGAHYLKVCATVDAIKGTVEAHQRAGRKRMDLKVLEDLLKQ
jgi:hypothetical protein